MSGSHVMRWRGGVTTRGAYQPPPLVMKSVRKRSFSEVGLGFTACRMARLLRRAGGDTSPRTQCMTIRAAPKLSQDGRVAVGQIRHFGRRDVAVPLRLMRVLGELAGATRILRYAFAVRDEARRLAAACAEGYPAETRTDSTSAWGPSSGPSLR
jgi:hypothetical protein